MVRRWRCGATLQPPPRAPPRPTGAEPAPGAPSRAMRALSPPPRPPRRDSPPQAVGQEFAQKKVRLHPQFSGVSAPPCASRLCSRRPRCRRRAQRGPAGACGGSPACAAPPKAVPLASRAPTNHRNRRGGSTVEARPHTTHPSARPTVTGSRVHGERRRGFLQGKSPHDSSGGAPTENPLPVPWAWTPIWVFRCAIRLLLCWAEDAKPAPQIAPQPGLMPLRLEPGDHS